MDLLYMAPELPKIDIFETILALPKDAPNESK